MKQPALKLVMALCGVMVSGVIHAAVQTPPAGSWDAFNSFRVDVAQEPGLKDSDSFRGRLDRASGDLRLDVDRTRAGKHQLGAAMLIGGRVFAYQGSLGMAAGQEAEIPYEALLRHIMAVRVLGVAFPDGYAALQGAKKFGHAEKEKDLRVVIGESQALIVAPWKVSGSVERVSETRLTYSFKAISGDRKKADKAHPYQEFHYTGELDMAATPAIDGGLALADWKLPNFQPPALPGVPEGVKTVADVRTVLAEWARPGVKDTAHDYVGDWRMNCNQPAGMRITRFGEEGMYAVSMCLKDRCVPEERTQKSFISGDVKYHVVDDKTIDFRYLDGRSDRYQRCGQ